MPVFADGAVRLCRSGLRGVTVAALDFPAAEADMLIGEDYMRGHRFWLSYATDTIFVQRLSGVKP